MTEKEHRKWRAYWAKHAADNAAEKDYRGASEAYASAAHHDGVLRAIKENRSTTKGD